MASIKDILGGLGISSNLAQSFERVEFLGRIGLNQPTKIDNMYSDCNMFETTAIN